MAGTPLWPTTLNEPGSGAADAGEALGAGTTGALRQGPDWHPSPQWALLLPQKPYMLQHEPCGQLPQTVLPLEAPQVPSVATAPVALEEAAEFVLEAGAMTGSVLLAPGFEAAEMDEEDAACEELS
jgi:hypothetical protein